MSEPSIAKPDFSRTLARGLDLLETLSDAAEPLSVSQTAERVGISRAASRRLLLTLRELGYVRTDGTRYWLTARVLQLGAGLVRSGGLWSSVAPSVIDLANRLNEPCSISVLDGSDTVFVCRDATRRIFTTRLGVGDRLPAHCSASGKMLLACLPTPDLDRVLVLRPLVARTPSLNHRSGAATRRSWLSPRARVRLGDRRDGRRHAIDRRATGGPERAGDRRHESCLAPDATHAG